MTLHSSDLTQGVRLVDVKSNQEFKENPPVSGTAPAILSIEAFCVTLSSCRSYSSVYLSGGNFSGIIDGAYSEVLM